jgi:hypothetical protein
MNLFKITVMLITLSAFGTRPSSERSKNKKYIIYRELIKLSITKIKCIFKFQITKFFVFKITIFFIIK